MRIVDKKQKKLTLESVDVQLFEEDLKRSPLMKGHRDVRLKLMGSACYLLSFTKKSSFFRIGPTPLRCEIL